MSLVAYGSSDESSDDEGNNENKAISDITILQTSDKLCLPMPKHDTVLKNDNEHDIDIKETKANKLPEKIHFDKLPKPKSSITEAENIVEEDDIPLKKEIEFKPEKPVKRDRIPVKITVPSLSEFKDVEKESEIKTNKIKPSNKGTKLFALLPPPKGIEIKNTNNLIPSVVYKFGTETSEMKDQSSKGAHIKDPSIKKTKPGTTKNSIGVTYESNSEDEDDALDSNSNCTTDFFALTTDTNLNSDSSNIDLNNIDAEFKNDSIKDNSPTSSKTYVSNPQKTLTSNVMNLPKEEILLKNKTEIGPKLPVPEQEYHVDTEGNVAFDEKAIEYLCGKRGVKRKPKEIEEASIIEINGEDIKPDEREWLVKALTEEPVQRPISMQSGGVSSQSKKKHQITYLAHQAKAMEMELKNQWAQNRLTRKQTQSKYGF